MFTKEVKSGVILAFCLTTVLFLSGCSREKAQNAQSQRNRSVPVTDSGGARVESYADVVERVTPAVVTVRSSKRVRMPRQFPFAADPSLQRFFGVPQGRGSAPQSQVQHGLGSGVLVRQDGYCITNYHVVDGAEEIKVEFTDGNIYDAKVIGSDPPSDLALLRVQGSNAAPITLGDSDRVRIGDIALAVGNPLGVGQTVTAGIVSAKGRTTGMSDGSFEDFLQTDAPINQGNSGGALVNTAGELIGINSQILSPSGGNIGIGFAIPVNMMKQVMDQVISSGHVRRGLLGITVQPITPELATALSLKDRHGVLVSGVQSGGPAEKAGLQRADVITRINDTDIDSANRLRNVVSSLAPGSDTRVTYQREGNQKTTTVKLGELKASDLPGSPDDTNQRGSNGQGSLGISVQPLTPDIARQLGVEKAEGVLVREVTPGGPADEAGLRSGDVIVQAERKPVRTIQELKSAVDAASGPVPLLVNRGGQTFFAVAHKR